MYSIFQAQYVYVPTIRMLWLLLFVDWYPVWVYVCACWLYVVQNVWLYETVLKRIREKKHEVRYSFLKCGRVYVFACRSAKVNYIIYLEQRMLIHILHLERNAIEWRGDLYWFYVSERMCERIIKAEWIGRRIFELTLFMLE